MARKSKGIPPPDEKRIIESVLFCRRTYHEQSEAEFAAWYERRYGIPEKRVLAILQFVREGKLCTG